MANEEFKMANVVNLHRRRSDRCVPWAEFEPLLNQLRNHLNATQDDAFRFIGYAGGTHATEWRKKNEVPITALYAIKWVLQNEANLTPAKPTKQTQLSIEELTDLLLVLRGRDVPTGPDLLRKIALMLAS